MKGIVKNITDIITNSSSEVFVMNKKDAYYYNELENTNGCINIDLITWKWLDNHYRYENDMISDMTGIKFDFDWYGLEDIESQWKKYKEENWLIIEEKLIGKYFVNIEDHFEDAYKVIEDAYCDCKWSDSRH